MPKPLKPHFHAIGSSHTPGVVVVRIPKNATRQEAWDAKLWARNMAQKVSRSHARDHWYGK